ncbi:MAG TPA: hypothetical protein VGF34_13290 [Stellaceae bacterium]
MANANTAETALECLEATGAILKCDRCNSEYIDAYDEEAQDRAYGMAENHRKNGHRGFKDMSREEVAAEIKAALDGTPGSCPRCF